MNRILLAFRAFFAILFTGALPADILAAMNAILKSDSPALPPPKPEVKPEDGALQVLGMLQRDARILDFFMEDITPYSDDQVGAAARDIHANTREILIRHFAPVPVIDAVEGTPVNSDGNPALVKFIGNVPATGKAVGGMLRHRGWRAGTASLPRVNTRQDLAILAPAEIEVE